MIESKPSVIFAMVTKFGAHISTLDAWHMLVVFKTSDLNKERCDPIIISFTIAFDDQASHDKCVISKSSHISWPPLCWSQGWWVNYKFICFGIEDSCGLQLCDIRTMTEFGLCIAANQVIVQGFGVPFSSLCICRKHFETVAEHESVHSHWSLSMVLERPIKVNCRPSFKVPLSILFTLEVQMIEFSHPVSLLFFGLPLVHLVSQMKLWIVIDIFEHLLAKLILLFVIDIHTV